MKIPKRLKKLMRRANNWIKAYESMNQGKRLVKSLEKLERQIEGKVG